jgi:hypothetical protein
MATVSDNLKSGVIKACFYEPAVNRTYSEMAAHYGTAVVPVEVGVQWRRAGSSPSSEAVIFLALRDECGNRHRGRRAQRPRHTSF